MWKPRHNPNNHGARLDGSVPSWDLLQSKVRCRLPANTDKDSAAALVPESAAEDHSESANWLQQPPLQLNLRLLHSELSQVSEWWRYAQVANRQSTFNEYSEKCACIYTLNRLHPDQRSSFGADHLVEHDRGVNWAFVSTAVATVVYGYVLGSGLHPRDYVLTALGCDYWQ